MMKFSILSIFFLLGAATTGFAQDTVMLNNGDILTGKILEQTADHVYFKSAAFGSISLNPNDIAEITIADEALGEITVPEEAIAKNEAKPGNLPPKEAPKAQTAAQPKPQPKQWSGQAGLAIAMREKTQTLANGSVRAEKLETYRLYGNVKWKGQRNDLRWDWTYRYSRDNFRTTNKVKDDYFNITQNYNHHFKNDNLFATAKTVYQRDYNRRIENEFLQTAELGINWFSKDAKVQLSTSAGGGYHTYERVNTTRTVSTSVMQPKFIFDQKLEWMVLPSKELELIQEYTHLGDLTNYHFLFSVGMQNRLVKDLFLRIEYRWDKDTEVFYKDKSYYDKALLTSLLYKF